MDSSNDLNATNDKVQKVLQDLKHKSIGNCTECWLSIANRLDIMLKYLPRIQPNNLWVLAWWSLQQILFTINQESISIHPYNKLKELKNEKQKHL